MGDEFIRHHVQCELGDLQLVLGDELKQQIEGAFEATDGDRKTGGRIHGDTRCCLVITVGGDHRCLRHRERSSRANWR